MQFTAIPTVSNGELLRDVRTLSVNPAINALNTLVPEHNAVFNTVNALTTTVADVRNEMNVVNGDYVGMRTDVNQVKTDITHLQATGTSLTQADAALKTRVDTLETRVNSIDARLSLEEAKNTRKRMIVDFQNLDIICHVGLEKNLIDLLKGRTPSQGAWGPGVDLSANKLVAPTNDDRTLFIKILMNGRFEGSPNNDTAGIQIHLTGGNIIDTYDSHRTNLSTVEHFQYFNMISYMKNDAFTQNGTVLTFVPLTKTLTIDWVRIIIEERA